MSGEVRPEKARLGKVRLVEVRLVEVRLVKVHPVKARPEDETVDGFTRPTGGSGSNRRGIGDLVR